MPVVINWARNLFNSEFDNGVRLALLHCAL